MFFFVLLQYLLLQKSLQRYFIAFVAVVTAICAAALLLQPTTQHDYNRIGNAIGVNPNWIGMLSAVAMGFCVILAAQRKKILWLLPILVLNVY